MDNWIQDMGKLPGGYIFEVSYILLPTLGVISVSYQITRNLFMVLVRKLYRKVIESWNVSKIGSRNNNIAIYERGTRCVILRDYGRECTTNQCGGLFQISIRIKHFEYA